MKQFTRVVKLIVFSFCFAVAQSDNLFAYKEYSHAAPGFILKIEKARDSVSGKIGFITNLGAPFAPTDLTNWESQEVAAHLGENGCFSDELVGKLLSASSNDSMKVAIYLKYPPAFYLDKTMHSQEELLANSQSVAAIAPVTTLNELALHYGIAISANNGPGVGICNLTKNQLNLLKHDASIGAIELIHKEYPQSPSLSTIAASAYNPGPVPSGAGYAIHAATFESGLSSNFLSCLGVTPASWDGYNTSDGDLIRHSNATFMCLVYTAPSATFYHRASATFDGTNDINYLINNSIQTVSMSVTRGGTSPYHSTYSEFLTMDDFAYRSPYPVFVTLSANAGYQYEANWQCYNAINVGNVRHTNNSTYEFADCTQTKNPPPIYGSCISGSGANCAGDRDMPNIVVPGIPYTGSDFATGCTEGSGSIYCATSWSAPIGNGIAADAIAADSRLSGWPEKVRATLILTAQNVDGGYSSNSSDGRDGSGVVSGSEAVSFASAHTSVSIGGSAAQKGMYASSMYASDFSGSNKRFYVQTPNPLPSGKHLRVVLTWDSNPIVGGSTNALSDLDLIVQVNGGTSGSYSWDNNNEIVDVDNSSLTAGSTYYVDVDPVTNRIPSSGSRTNFFYWAVAWEWVADHAP